MCTVLLNLQERSTGMRQGDSGMCMNRSIHITQLINELSPIKCFCDTGHHINNNIISHYIQNKNHTTHFFLHFLRQNNKLCDEIKPMSPHSRP